ncbi:hypothetical protein ACFQZ4_43740 [Catellatospora coxensis]
MVVATRVVVAGGHEGAGLGAAVLPDRDGESWPQADEDQLRALARLYAALEEILAAVEEELVAIADAVEGGVGKVRPRRRRGRG